MLNTLEIVLIASLSKSFDLLSNSLSCSYVLISITFDELTTLGNKIIFCFSNKASSQKALLNLLFLHIFSIFFFKISDFSFVKYAIPNSSLQSSKLDVTISSDFLFIFTLQLFVNLSLTIYQLYNSSLPNGLSLHQISHGTMYVFDKYLNTHLIECKLFLYEYSIFTTSFTPYLSIKYS